MVSAIEGSKGDGEGFNFVFASFGVGVGFGFGFGIFGFGGFGCCLRHCGIVLNWEFRIEESGFTFSWWIDRWYR